MDARTGLGRFHEFRISNYRLMMALIDYCARVHGNLVLLDLRQETVIHAGNRKRTSRSTCCGACSSRTPCSTTDIGALMLEYGGGGHENAGTCQVDNEMVEDVLGALVNRINKDG